MVYANNLIKNIPYSDLEKLNRNERILYEGELGNLLSDDAVPYLEPAVRMYSGRNRCSTRTKEDLDKRVLSGELIYL